MSFKEQVKKLKEQVKDFPKKPGVYLFKKGKKVLYVGKAADLRQRVKSYLTDPQKLSLERGEHIAQMVQIADKVEYKQTNTSLEAVVLEANLIKKYQPEYNTKEKSNKSFNFLVITNDEFPLVKIVRGKEVSLLPDEKIKYVFGPFPNSQALRISLKILRKIFPFSDKCRPPKNKEKAKPCFYAQLGLCPGVCTGKADKKEYLQNIKNIKLFFEGKKEKILKNLEKQMQKYSENLEFEKAAKIRDQIEALENIKEASLIEELYKVGEAGAGLGIRKIEGYDISHIAGKERIGAIVSFKDGQFDKTGYRIMKIRTKEKGDTDALKELIKRRLKHKEWELPDLIVVDGGKAQLNAALEAVKEAGENIDVVSVLKNKSHKPVKILGAKKLIATLQKNTIFKIDEEAHRFAISAHRRARKNKGMF